MIRLASPLAAVVALAALATPAAAETVTCTEIASLPATLTTQGVYCLRHDLATGLSSGNAVTVSVNNVTIDCNGYKIGGLAAGTGTQAVGIRSASRLNTVIRNCGVRGFQYGIWLDGGGHVVEGNRLDNNTRMGLLLFGDGSVARDNRVLSTGGAAVAGIPYIGIYTSNSVDLRDNTVAGVAAPAGSNGSAVGIYTYANAAGAIDRNRVRGVAGDGIGATWGIQNTQSGRLSIRGNQLVGDATGTAVGCTDDGAVASGNHLYGFATAIAACRDGGGNHF